jgi:outer membrane receptor protein involved in Fe transport
MKQHITKIVLLFCLFFSIVGTLAAQRTITGKVTDDGGSALPGVTVVVKGTTSGATSDADGNYSISIPGSDAVLVFSFVGQQTQEVVIGSGQSVVNVELADSDNLLDAVFVTATSRPVRKLETITAVEAIGMKELARVTPTSIADALRFTPGVFVNAGPGRTRNGIFVRGFPDLGSNGLIYTSLLFDGLRTFASPEMVPDAAFRMDMNMERIEVVRGSAATLYGRGAAAGAINVISKTGGEKLAGGARYTWASRGMSQVDLNLNGAITKDLRFNVGGFYLNDPGLRNNPFPDQGYQVRGNLDYFLPKGMGKIRLSGGTIDLNVQNQIDLPYLARDLSKPAPGYTSLDVITPKEAYDRTFNKDITLTYPDGTAETFNIANEMKRGNFSKGYNFGLDFDIKLGKGFSIVNKGRYQDMVVGTQFDFPLTTNYGAAQNRVLFVGNKLSEGGSHAKDFINEIRLQKAIAGANSTHNLTAGYYFSTIDVRAVAIGHFYNINTSVAADRAASVQGALGFGPAPVFLNSLFRNGTYVETVHSAFVGDEMKFGKKLTINAGIRYDVIDLEMDEDRYIDASQRNAVRNVIHPGFSGSAGFNYLLSENSAIYGNYVRAYRAPDYSAYTTVQYAKYTRDASGNITGITRLVGNDAIQFDEKGRILYLNNYVEQNEIINSFELGFRTMIGTDMSFDGGLFLNNITDRLVSSFIGATAVQVPGGDNRIMGTEISLYYTPSQVKGLYARTSLTAQQTEYTRLIQSLSFTDKRDISGNRVAGIPGIIWNLSIGYEKKNFGANFNNNLLASRPVDPFNVINYPTMSISDANAYYQFVFKNKSKAKVKASVTNLFDSQAAVSVVSASADNVYYNVRSGNFAGNFTHVRGVPNLPRRVWLTLEYLF